ncbi:hypothetical protein YQE_07387, partial [Dendroctonus ponderosae]
MTSRLCDWTAKILEMALIDTLMKLAMISPLKRKEAPNPAGTRPKDPIDLFRQKARTLKSPTRLTKMVMCPKAPICPLLRQSLKPF